MGFVLADINGDGRQDLMVGGYSSSKRKFDEDKSIHDVLGRLAWFERPSALNDPWERHDAALNDPWERHDVSRRIRSMFDQFIPTDLDEDGDLDFMTTRGNSFPYDGVLWLEQVRTDKLLPSLEYSRGSESRPMGLPEPDVY
jgi:hypothetical protein